MAQPVHNLPEMSATYQGDRVTYRETYEGLATELESDFATHPVGAVVSDTGSAIPSINAVGNFGAWIVTGQSINRKNGGLAEGTIDKTVLLKRESWNIEWSEINKDIRTWISSKNCANPVTGASAAQQLAMLANWENLASANDWENYAAFNYATGGTYAELPEPVLTVAHKILKGVQSYSIFAPVVTRTTVHPWLPPVSGNLGKRNTPVAGTGGWSSYSGSFDFSSIASGWLKNVERSSPNGDGTFTLTEGWLGADEVDGDLYKGA